MTTPQPTPLPGLPATRNSPDRLANLILTSKTLTAAAELMPFPYVKGALGPVIPILEAVQKMRKNREDFEELCESIVSTVTILEKIAPHGADATSSLKRLCEDLRGLLQEIELKVGQIQKNQKNRVSGILKEFIKSTSIGDELDRYKTRVEQLRSDFMLMSMAQLNSLAQLNINASVPVTQASPPPVTTSCPPPSRMFHGRRDILDKLQAYFSRDIGTRHISLLHGLGGAGKTQICLKFLAESDKSRFTDVFFLDASTVDTINSGLKNIALTQSLGSEADDASHWLASSQDEWLLIFDNADDPSINLFHYFPQSSSGNILITSRNPQLYVHAPDSHHHITDMDEEDAVRLLLASAIQPSTSETENLARDIVKALYCFPLAVVQAGAYIAKTRKLRNYLAFYEQNHAALLSRLPDQSHDKYAWSVYTTWDISFKCLGELATKFLQVCSLLHHERISEDIFSCAATYKHKCLGPTEEQMKEPRKFLNEFLTQAGTWDEVHFTDVTTEIMGYSLINRDPNTSLLSIHPLVHDWCRKTIMNTTSTQECSAAILAMATMSTLHDQVFHISLLPHLNSVLHGEPQISHKFPYPYGRLYYDSGHFTQSRELCMALLEDRKQTLGSEHPETLDAMSSLAVTYWAMGRATEAEELQVAVLQNRKQILGPEHPDTLVVMSDLAATYHSLGKLTDAEELYVVVLEKRKQILGPEHPDTLHAMSDLATTYHNLGKLTDAEELKVVVLEKRRQIWGTEHPDTLATILSLAATYHDLGKLTEAEELKEVVLEKRKQILGSEHPSTLAAMSSLAVTYHSLGKLTDAEELYVVALEKRGQILGPEHPDTLHAMSDLATTYHSLGKLTDAEELYVVVLKKRKQKLGSDHPDTLTAMFDLAITYHSLGKLTDAEELKVVVFEKRKQILGPEHPDTLHAMSHLAVTYHSLGKLTDAEDLEVTVLEKRKQILGPEHPDILDVMLNLATTYWKLGKFTDAEELEVAVLEKRKQLFGTEHPKTLTSMRNLAFTCQDLGKLEEAEHLLLTVVEIWASTLGPEHKDTIQAQGDLTQIQKLIEDGRTASGYPVIP
ncbi:hypothetical protein C8J57DRAFT_165428 [Mycena rebaudengoi]|nr:hypothetical protein C8J57DRAFT_165428 [Mycena rebaudengoi]